MKGVVLCGGTGSRLDPITRVTNKHLLPIYDEPMVFHPIRTLVNAGITDIMLVTGGNNAGDFVPLLGNGADFGLKHLNYTYQKGAGGIAAALRLCAEFVGEDSVAVILGDNIFGSGIHKQLAKWVKKPLSGAVVFLKEVEDPERFGVATLEGDRVVGIVEKPKAPESNWAVTGLYLYDARVFRHIEKQKPSGRGELEITDVNNAYVAESALRFVKLDDAVEWTDAGTFESLHRANLLVAKMRRKAAN
jgi:glucose-1-phosphate thymidylyltransferase